MRFLALSGSLRRASLNSALLRATARLAPPNLQVVVFDGLGRLPLFNPDQADAPVEAVQRLFRAVAQADALIVASPEYAHGVSGVIKNALDWLVGFGPFAGKSVAVLNASDRARHADAALRETLTTMAARIVEPASITLPILGADMGEDAMVKSPDTGLRIRQMLADLRQGVVLHNREQGAAPTISGVA
jgi:chromate reductase, NAD(P)H dehydrogenase (quinone)